MLNFSVKILLKLAPQGHLKFQSEIWADPVILCNSRKLYACNDIFPSYNKVLLKWCSKDINFRPQLLKDIWDLIGLRETIVIMPQLIERPLKWWLVTRKRYHYIHEVLKTPTYAMKYFKIMRCFEIVIENGVVVEKTQSNWIVLLMKEDYLIEKVEMYT